jgi:hypothetical protein
MRKTIQTIKERAVKNERLQRYLKDNNLSFRDVKISELTDKGWRVLQAGVSEADILIMSSKFQMLLPL